MFHKNEPSSTWKWNRKNAQDFEIPSLIDFLRSSRSIPMYVITLIFLLVTYGMRLTFYSTTMDQDAVMDYTTSSIYNSWFVLGRFGLVFTRQLFHMMQFNPFFELAFTVVFIFGACISWEYVFYVLRGKNNHFQHFRWIFPILFLTSPLLALQFNFLNQSFFVSLCFISMAFSFLFLYKWIFQHTWLDLLIGFILTFWCFSVYQSFVPLYISAASATFLLIYRRYYFLPKEQKPQNIGLFRICLKILAVFVGAFILYTIINKITAAHYGGMNAYISGQIMWGHLPVSQCIHHVLAGIYHILSGQTALYNLAFPLMALILIIVSLIKIRHFYKGYALYLLITAIFILSPFFMIVLMGAEPAMRTQFSLPFVVAFGADFLISLIPPVYKKVRAIIALFCVLITFDQASVTSRLFYTEYARYQKDVAYCTQIANSIDKLELTTTSSLPVVFVGGHHIQLNQDTLPVEGVGTSTLEIESFSPSRTLLFMKTLGYNYIFPTSAQYEKGHQLSTDMPIWPAEGSVQIKDNLVVIRLS